MKQDISIVILTAGYGNGHIQVARTLQQAFTRFGIESASILDLYQEAHPGMNSISRYLYICSPFFSNYGLDYYGWTYYATRNIEETSALAKCAGVIGMKKLISILKERKADAIVSTFPFGGISHQLQKHGIHIPLFTVVTDFSLHSRWLHNRPDRFFVATGDLKQEMIRRGVWPGTITVSGIPLREPFYEPSFPEPQNTQQPSRSILVMMGALVPLPDIQRLVASLLDLPDVRVDIVCGGNNKLRQKLERRFGGHSRLRLFGFVDAVHDRMRCASCIITKAGGITLSEAIQIRTPIVIYKPFSGQERENARYLERKGAAAVAKNVRQLLPLVSEIIDSKATRDKMMRQCDALTAGHAADIIVKDVLRLVRGLPATANG